MSSRPIGPDSGVQRLTDEGYCVEVREQHLLLHDVPYVTVGKEVKSGTLACTYVKNAETVLPPDNHQVWWTEEYPCFADGTPISQIQNENTQQQLFPGFTIRHRFSNKPEGVSGFSDHYSKLLHYVRIIEDQAKALDHEVDARKSRGNLSTISETSPFTYEDSASARAEIQTTTSRLALRRVAIIGLGGTGSYILDQLAKTPISEIHLFDGDVYLQHNAFRSPGAATLEELAFASKKTDYFARKYGAMHKGIKSHPYNIESETLSDLVDLDFAFISVDAGPVRKMLFDYFMARRTPFIDVGMNLQLVATSGKLVGLCRTTLVTPTENEHFGDHVPLDSDDGADALYRQNIQVADMNALNAQLAVMIWKQYFGFYNRDFPVTNLVFSVNSLSLAWNTAFSRDGT